MGKRSSVTVREVITGNISKIVKTTETKISADVDTLAPDTNLRRSKNEHIEFDAEPAGEAEDLYMNGCIASTVNGYRWVSEPCVKMLSDRRITLNDAAFKAFGLCVGMRFVVSMTKTKSEIRLRKVTSSFMNRVAPHREGCYRLKDIRTKTRGCTTSMGCLESKGSCGITLLKQNPALVGFIFRLWQHPEDRNLLVMKADTGFRPNGITADKLTIRTEPSLVRPLSSQCQRFR